MSTDLTATGPVAQRDPTLWVTAVIGCVTLVSLGVVSTFLGMRAVLDVGGSCADGGPYVSAQPCPDGASLVAAGVPMMVILGMAGSGAAMVISAPTLLLPMWIFLFGSLGWNFLEYGAFRGHIEVGSLVCGIVFELMALPVLVMVIKAFGVRSSTNPRAQELLAVRDSKRVMSPTLWWVVYAGFGTVGALLGVWSFNSWT